MLHVVGRRLNKRACRNDERSWQEPRWLYGQSYSAMKHRNAPEMRRTFHNPQLQSQRANRAVSTQVPNTLASGTHGKLSCLQTRSLQKCNNVRSIGVLTGLR